MKWLGELVAVGCLAWAGSACAVSYDLTTTYKNGTNLEGLVIFYPVNRASRH